MIEFTPQFRPRLIRHVLMDWDGTTALSRAGWSDVMTEIYLAHLPALASEDAASRRAFAWAELMSLNGRPSIHQMAHLADLIVARGGRPAAALHYQSEFQARLGALVQKRLARVQAGQQAAEALLVPGVRELLELLHSQGLPCTLASGTPLPQLQAEAELLGVAKFFDGRIFGPSDVADTTFAKRAVIHDLLHHHGIDGPTLLAFGDGPVEISETKAVGGLAIAVASDELHPGRIDQEKRTLLLATGADAVIADFREAAGWWAQVSREGGLA